MFTELFDSLVDVDLNQARIDTALPIPRGDLTITQSFVPRHDGLQEIELTLARYGETTEIDNGRLTLQLLAENGDLLGEKALETAAVAHNQVVKFPLFPPGGFSRTTVYAQGKRQQRKQVCRFGDTASIVTRTAPYPCKAACRAKILFSPPRRTCAF